MSEEFIKTVVMGDDDKNLIVNNESNLSDAKLSDGLDTDEPGSDEKFTQTYSYLT